MSLESILSSLEVKPLFPFTLTNSNTTKLDLSKSNTNQSFLAVNDCGSLHNYIQQEITDKGALYAIGGYLETRKVYERFTHFNNTGSEERYIHLGIDVWCDALTPVFSPINGTVHSFNINDNAGDYGGTIILQHQINGHQFYSLYGHLSHSSVKDLAKGQVINAGQQIATLGSPKENGGWPPHLHFQLIKDIGKHKGDYPGVCSKSELEFFKENCPDPGLVLRVNPKK